VTCGTDTIRIGDCLKTLKSSLLRPIITCKYLILLNVKIARRRHQDFFDTYEKAVCQVNKLYQLPVRGPQIGLIAKHLSVFTQRCHTIMHLINGVPISLSASHFVGHVEKRATHKQDKSPDTVFGFSKRRRHTARSYGLWPQWPFDSPP
jgi:hypothetical protein